MLHSVEAVPTSSPALALRASLAATGLLRHASAPQDSVSGAWSTAQAVHQGDRLLRTARSLLSAHAQACGEHASLWATDGPDLVAVMAEHGIGGPPLPGTRVEPGCRLTVGLEVSGLLAQVASTAGTQEADAPGQHVWTALMRQALGLDAGAGSAPGCRLVASVWPWRAWPMVLLTIDRAPARPSRGHAQTRPGHAQRHASLALGLAWGMDAVVR